MSSQKAELYILQNDDTEEWVSPQPADAAITEAVIDQTALSEDDFDSPRSYVDYEELRAVLENESNSQLTFSIEGHDVTVEKNGEITVTG